MHTKHNINKIKQKNNVIIILYQVFVFDIDWDTYMYII